MFRRALPLVLIVMIAACGSEPAQAPPPANVLVEVEPPAPFAVGDVVRLTGFDVATGRVEVTEINLWATPQRAALACRLKHAATATVSAREYVRADGRWYFALSSGSCSGWVPASFVEAAR